HLALRPARPRAERDRSAGTPPARRHRDDQWAGGARMNMSEPKHTPHLRKQGSATQLIVDGQPFLVLGGELHNSSASNIEYMRPIWERMVALNLNTVLAAVAWE